MNGTSVVTTAIPGTTREAGWGVLAWWDEGRRRGVAVRRVVAIFRRLIVNTATDLFPTRVEFGAGGPGAEDRAKRGCGVEKPIAPLLRRVIAFRVADDAVVAIPRAVCFRLVILLCCRDAIVVATSIDGGGEALHRDARRDAHAIECLGDSARRKASL